MGTTMGAFPPGQSPQVSHSLSRSLHLVKFLKKLGGLMESLISHSVLQVRMRFWLQRWAPTGKRQSIRRGPRTQRRLCSIPGTQILQELLFPRRWYLDCSLHCNRPEELVLSHSTATQTVSSACFRGSGIRVQRFPFQAVPVTLCIHESSRGRPCHGKGSVHPKLSQQLANSSSLEIYFVCTGTWCSDISAYWGFKSTGKRESSL